MENCIITLSSLSKELDWSQINTYEHIKVTECLIVNDGLKILSSNFFDDKCSNIFSIYFEIKKKLNADKLDVKILERKFRDRRMVLGFESSEECCVLWKLKTMDNFLQLRIDEKRSFEFIYEKIRKNIEENRTGVLKLQIDFSNFLLQNIYFRCSTPRRHRNLHRCHLDHRLSQLQSIDARFGSWKALSGQGSSLL